MTTRLHEFDEALESIERDSVEELMTKKKTKPKMTTKKTKLKKTRNSKKFVINSGQVMAVLGNWAEGFQLVGPFTDFEAADDACPTAAWLWSVEPPSDPDTNWANDGIQFARLIAELEATGRMHGELVSDLMRSMDLTSDEIYQIVERAQQVWDEIKRQT